MAARRNAVGCEKMAFFKSLFGKDQFIVTNLSRAHCITETRVHNKMQFSVTFFQNFL
jgi:hypothetical protein